MTIMQLVELLFYTVVLVFLVTGLLILLMGLVASKNFKRRNRMETRVGGGMDEE